MDGTFKELRYQSHNTVTFAGGGGGGTVIMQSSFRRHNEEIMLVGDKALGYENPLSVIDIEGTDNSYAITGPGHLMAHLWPLSSASNAVSFYRARISMTVKKNEEMHVINIRQQWDDTAATSGTSELMWEIKQVISPFVFMFDQSQPIGLRFMMIVRINSSLVESNSTQFPCAGYLTNISVLSSLPGAGDWPQWLVLTTDDIDIVDHLLQTAGTNGLRGSNKNSVIFENYQSEDALGTHYIWNYQHFGKTYIRLVNRAVLNMIWKSEGTDLAKIVISADFIPFKGASWKQIYVMETELADPAAANFSRGIEFGVDLDNCQIAVIATIAGQEAGILVCRVIDPSSETVSTMVTEGDQIDSTPYNQEGIHSAQNEVGIIPLTGTGGGVSPVMSLGNVKAGQLFVWDFMTGESITAASDIMFVITGKVGKEYYSKSNAFILDPITFNMNSEVFRL